MLLSLVLFSVTNLANAQVPKSEIISRVEKDTAQFQRAPLVVLPSEVNKKIIEHTKARFPTFKESMWYYHYILDKGFYTIVFYDWTGDQCMYLVFNKDALQKKDAQVSDFLRNPSHGNAMARKEALPMPVCEKLYNFYSGKKG